MAALPSLKRDISQAPGTYEAKGLWESYAQPGGLAVESVSWNDCQEWLQRLNLWLKEQWPELGGQGEAPQLALPSESQWEAACRAGASTPFHFGNTLDARWANYDAGYTYGPGRKGAYRQRPVPMGFFGLVNRWGLAEMHGQLLEWCADQWHRSPIREDLGQRRGWFGGGGRTQELLDGRAVEGPDRGLADVPPGTTNEAAARGLVVQRSAQRPRRLPGRQPPWQCQLRRWRPSRLFLPPRLPS